MKPKGLVFRAYKPSGFIQMEVWQAFPPRTHTCGSHQEKDEHNVSKAVRS